jgi:hypothetical protein
MEGFRQPPGMPGGVLDENEEGLIPRAIKDLFAAVEVLKSQGTRRVSVSCSYLQLYNEKIYDLLNTDTYKRKIVRQKD